MIALVVPQFLRSRSHIPLASRSRVIVEVHGIVHGDRRESGVCVFIRFV